VSDLAGLARSLAAAGRAVDGAPLPLVAVGWATVETERTLDGLAALGPLAVGEPTTEPSLGAFARVVTLPGCAVVILEPSTEGRLAAALARRAEGIAALYLAGDPGPGARSTALGRPGRLLPHDRPWGPFTILVAPADPAAP